MKVRQKLKINSIVTILTVVLISVVLFLGLHEIKKAVNASRLTDGLITGSFERSTFRNDYVKTGSERAKDQLLAKHEQIGKLLQSASKTFHDPEDLKTIQSLIKDQESTGILIQDLVNNREMPKQDSTSDVLAEKREERLITQLDMRLYTKIMLARMLRESSDSRLTHVLTLAGLSILCVLAVLIAGIGVNSWTMERTINDRIRKLKDGISVIGGGILDHVIDVKGNDEFAELSDAFNAMAAELRKSYHALGREIDMRMLAERELERQMGEARRTALELDAVFRVLPYFVSVMGKDGGYLRVNPAMEDFFGFDFTTATQEEVSSMVQARFPDGQRITQENLLSSRALRGETVRDVEYVVTNRQGEERVLLGNAVPLKIGDEMIGAVLAHFDITERKHAQQELLKANDRLEERVFQRTKELQEAVIVIEEEGQRYRELNQTLEQRIQERTLELQETVENLRASRKAALNLMEDAMIARKLAEEANDELRREIAARLLAEEDLRKSEQKLRLFIEHAPAAIAMFDRSMKYLAVSRRWLADYNLGDRDIIGRCHYEIFPEIPGRWEKIHQRGLAGEIVSCEEDPFPRLDGRMDWVRWEVRPWYGSGGDIGGIIMFSEVITMRKLAEDRLRESEERFRATLENMLEGCQIIGSDWRYLYLNHSAEIQNKRPKEELLGRRYMDMWPGIEGTEVFRVIRHALEDGVSHHMENEFAFPDGSRGWFDLSIQPIPEGVFILSIDITWRKKMETALQESLEHLHLAHKAAHSGTWEWDVRTNENIWSDEIWDLYRIGLWSVEPSYESWRQVVHPDDLIKAEMTIQTALKNGEELNMEFRVKSSDRMEHWLMSRAQPVRDDKGQVVRYIGIVMEITERKKMEQEVFNALVELERSNKELEQFAYVASHDLQEPLRMVSSFTQLLARRYGDKLDQNAREYIDFAVKGSNRMQRMIQDLLHYSRVVTRGKDPVPTDMENVLDETLANLGLAISDSGASVTRDALPVVMGDNSNLVQVLQNLIANAIKFRRDEPLWIHVSAARAGDEWVFSVKDNGMGIDPQYFERIFVLFERLHAGETYRGTGIGLALCKRIIQRLGGRIWVESEPGKGSTFYFTLKGR